MVVCIATHYHDDRTSGLDYYQNKGVSTYSSKLTFDLCAEHDEKQAEQCFSNDTTFNIGNHSFQTYYAGEGHTKDNIVIWCNDAKILYGGCLVKSTESLGLGNTADANVIPGHFGWKSNQGLAHTLELLNKK